MRKLVKRITEEYVTEKGDEDEDRDGIEEEDGDELEEDEKSNEPPTPVRRRR